MLRDKPEESMDIPAEQTDWVLAEIRRGTAPERLLATLIERGVPEDPAIDFLTRTLESELVALQDSKLSHAHAPPSAISPVPEPLGLDWPSVVSTPDRDVQVLFSLDHPRVVLFGGLLADSECDALVEMAQARIEASQVIDLQTGHTRQDDGRSSSGMAFSRGENSLLKNLEGRISALLRWPIDHGEAIQVLRYQIGQEYRPHYDYVDPSKAGAASFLARGGQRVASLVMYLNTPARGGGTNFPDGKLEVAAHKGNAVFFSYGRPDSTTGTLHGGMPVLAGEKWVATKWLRELPHA
jgi:prolyl 4-hydroxylase